jgi:hypothetical protein
MTDERESPEPVVRVPAPSKPRRRRKGTGGHVAIALGVLAIWACSALADIFSGPYSPPEGLNTIALAAATFLFTYAFRKENTDD